MKFNKLLILILTISLSFSCSKDDKPESSGELIFDNQSYDLNNGYIYHNPSLDYNIFAIHLSNDKTTFTENGRSFGKNSKTTIDLLFINENKLDNEISNYYQLNYNYITNENLENEPPFLTNAVVNLNLNKENSEWNANPKIVLWKDGSATIEKINKEYKITFTLNSENKVIIGSYIGSLEKVESF